MIDILNYFYNINVSEASGDEEKIRFKYQNNNYLFTKVYRPIEEIKQIYELSINLLTNYVPCHEIILNRNDEIITFIEEKTFILLKNNIDSSEKITLNDIIKFTQKTICALKNTNLNRNNWKELWINKIDALEYIINSCRKNNLYEFYYYQGIVENCIQMLNEFNRNSDVLSIAHKRLSYQTTYDEFYNPLNFIIDSTSRDISEYLKSKFIIGIDIIYEMCYLLNNYSNLYNFQFLFCRLLFPSYQLDIFEKNNYDNKLVLINKNYEKGIKKIYALISAYTFLPNINWLHQ